MRKSIGIFTCSNGYGHYKRISEIADYLSIDFDITIYAGTFQVNKFGLVSNTKSVIQQFKNIRWDETLQNSKVNFTQYKKSIDEFGTELKKYDYVIADNIAGILEHRPDCILIGSFFWKDVFLKQFGENKISDFDQELIDKYNPLVLTNKYAETGTLREYKNKLQFGFGCKDLEYKQFKIEEILTLEPSLNYIDSYSDFFSKLKVKTTIDFTKKANIALMCRPGLGIITHCVENYIPLIALYDENDSTEIVELAQTVENLKIGFKQNVHKEFNEFKYNVLKDNSIYMYNKFEKEGYKKIASYLKNKL
jgi:hypothetical protein